MLRRWHSSPGAGSRRPGGRDAIALGSMPAVVGVSVVAHGVHAGGVDTAGTSDAHVTTGGPTTAGDPVSSSCSCVRGFACGTVAPSVDGSKLVCSGSATTDDTTTRTARAKGFTGVLFVGNAGLTGYDPCCSSKGCGTRGRSEHRCECPENAGLAR